MPKDSDYPTLSVTALADHISAGDLTATRVVEACLARIHDRNERTNAFVHVFDTAARDAAAAADEAASAGDPLGPLHGVPIAIKDLTPVADAPTTYGSVPLANYVPTQDAPSVARLRDAGAIIIGKTNTSEFGHIATTDNDLFGPTATPFNPDRTAGGSSGGSAAAVADRLVPAALGTDAGGSVRIPASACGVYGLKPSYGRIPRRTRPNAFADTNPFTTDGPLTRTVADTALMLDVLAGPHPADPLSLPAPPGPYHDVTTHPVDDLTAAYTPDLSVFTIDPEVQQITDDAVETIGSLGPTVTREDPALGDVWPDMQTGSMTIFQARMAEIVDTSPDVFGVDLQAHHDDLTRTFAAMVDRGRTHSAVDVGTANATRTRVYDRIQAVFAEYDLILTPTLAVQPFYKGIVGPDEIDGESVNPYTDWYLTQPFNMTGHPAASIPVGHTQDGLPVGLQIVGRRHADDTVLTLSAAIERATPWHDTYPT